MANKKFLVMDYGQVMVKFSPKDMTAALVKFEDDRKLVSEVLFDRLYWDRLDAGSIDDEELLSAVHARLPKRLWEAADTIYANWIYMLPEIPGMKELVLDFKHRYSLSAALLSNIGSVIHEREDEIPLLKIFEKKVYSAVCGFTKPEPGIFDYLCKTCEISPEDAIFVDDSQKNVDGAQEFGIDAILFTGDTELLREEIEKILNA